MLLFEVRNLGYTSMGQFSLYKTQRIKVISDKGDPR